MKNILSCLFMMAWLLAAGPYALAIETVESQTPVPKLEFGADKKMPIDVATRMLFIEDPEHTLSRQDVLSSKTAWQEISRTSPNFGFTSSAFWFRFDIVNTETRAMDALIELPIPFLDDVEFSRFERASSGIRFLESYRVGDKYPFSDRPIQHQNHVVPITLSPGENQMLVRVAAAGTVEVPIYIWRPEAFMLATAEDRLLQGIWFGIVGIMVIYNLFLFFSIRDKSYLYYVGFAFGYLMFQVCLKGYGFAYLWPNQLYWNSFAISVFIALCNLSAAMLVISFLRLKRNTLFGYRLISLMALISGVLLILSFVLPYSITVRLTSAMTVITCSLSLAFGYWMWWKGDHYARYFCFAWTAAFGGIGIFSAEKFGVLHANFWTTNAGQIGVMMLVALLSLALANRFNREKELRLSAQESSLESEKLARRSQDQLLKAKVNANRELEHKVAERTQTLQQALEELEHANTRLELLSTTDSLTTLFNRGHFENRLDIEFKRALRHHRDLSVILCDIDHFKQINDGFGHKAGDECLRQVALIFKNKITRSGDVIARYGGEEFIILLVDTPLIMAEQVAENLRQEIEHMAMQTDRRPVPVTASFGIASLNQSPLRDAEELVHRADIALYEAKNTGRNRVRTWGLKNTAKTGSDQSSSDVL